MVKICNYTLAQLKADLDLLGLDVSKIVTLQQARRAYLLNAHQYHPSRLDGGNPAAMQRVNEAFNRIMGYANINGGDDDTEIFNPSWERDGADNDEHEGTSFASVRTVKLVEREEIPGEIIELTEDIIHARNERDTEIDWELLFELEVVGIVFDVLSEHREQIAEAGRKEGHGLKVRYRGKDPVEAVKQLAEKDKDGKGIKGALAEVDKRLSAASLSAYSDFAREVMCKTIANRIEMNLTEKETVRERGGDGGGLGMG